MGIPRAASLVRRIPRLTGANAATVIRRADERDDTEERPLAADTVRCRRPPPSPRPVPPGRTSLSFTTDERNTGTRSRRSGTQKESGSADGGSLLVLTGSRSFRPTIVYTGALPRVEPPERSDQVGHHQQDARRFPPCTMSR